jgi:TolB-like protein
LRARPHANRKPARARHTSSFAFKGKTEDIRKIGEQLNVGKFPEGSLAKPEISFWISAQLINEADGLWANHDREMDISKFKMTPTVGGGGAQSPTRH